MSAQKQYGSKGSCLIYRLSFEAAEGLISPETDVSQLRLTDVNEEDPNKRFVMMSSFQNDGDN